MKFAAAIVLVQALALSGASLAQSYPSKPIRLVTPNTPGAAPDVLGRLLAPALGDSLGQPVVFENRIGASGMIGAGSVARSAPDGYTFMLAASGGPMVAVVFLNKNVPYDPLRSFVSIGPAVEPVTLLVARPDLPGRTFADVVEAARANPGKITVGSSGLGTEFHLQIEAMNLAGARFMHVPYKGTPQSMQDVVAGNLDITFGTVPSTRGLRSSGKLKVLAIASDKLERYGPLKDTPTIKEVLPNFTRSTSFYSFWGPAGMPDAIVARLNAELLKAMALPPIRSWLEENGVVIIARSATEARALHEESFESYRSIVKAVGIEPQ